MAELSKKPCTNRDLAAIFNYMPDSMDYHLRKLREMGVVEAAGVVRQRTTGYLAKLYKPAKQEKEATYE